MAVGGNSWFTQPVYVPGGDPEDMNEATLLYPGQLGVRFAFSIPSRSAPTAATGAGTNKAYKLVQIDSSIAVTAAYHGAVAWFADQAARTVTTVPTTLGRGRVAGIFRKSSGGYLTPGRFTCIQVKGLADSVKFIDAPPATPSAAGLIVIPSATAGKADCLAAGSAATYPALGRTAGAFNAVEVTATVDLDVPEVLG